VSEAGRRSAWASPGFLLWHATLRWQRAVAAALRPLGLTHVQFVLLAGVWWLAQGDQRPNQRELADHAGTDRMMTSQVVRTLESRGLLLRGLDEVDARVRRLAVTPEGERLAVEAIAAVEATDEAYFASVPDREDLMVLLRGLAGREAATLAN
jgi:DNA-binding MarR family transcriptional regulator